MAREMFGLFSVEIQKKIIYSQYDENMLFAVSLNISFWMKFRMLRIGTSTLIDWKVFNGGNTPVFFP